MKKLILLAILFLSAPFFYFTDGSIIKDFQLKSETLIDANLRTTDRKCKTRIFLLHSCGFKYEVNGEKHEQDYYFLSFGSPKTLTMLRSMQSGRLTSDVGQDYLTNRVLTMLLFPALALFWIFMSRAKSRRSAQGEPATPKAQPSSRSTGTNVQNTGRKQSFGKRR